MHFFANLRLRSPIGAVQITQQVAQSNKLSFFQSWPTEKSHDATAMHWRYLAANCRLIGRRICDPTANPFPGFALQACIRRLANSTVREKVVEGSQSSQHRSRRDSRLQI
jgi:hypothetical protein